MAQLIVGQLLNGAIVGTLYGIVALGVTLTFGITGIVNFALGAFMMLGGYAAWYLTDEVGVPYPLAVAGAVVITAVAGLIADRGLFRFTRNNLVNGLLVSIGLIAVMEAGALLIWTSTPKDMHYVLPGVVSIAGVMVSKMKLVVFAVLLTVIVATYAALTRTWVGRAAYAYAQNAEAAELMGVRTGVLQSSVVVYSTGLAGLGGALYASLYSLEPTMGSMYVLKAVESAILGRHRQRGRIALRRRDLGRHGGHGVDVRVARVPRRLRSPVPGGDPAVQARRPVRETQVKTSTRNLVAPALLLAIPLVVRSDFMLTIFVFAFLLGMLAVSFNVVFGFTGQLSLFHAAAFGIAAYATHISTQLLGLSFWSGMLLAAAFVAFLSVVVGVICFRFRLKEFYFAVVTLAFSEMARLVIVNSSVTNGTLGIVVQEKPQLSLGAYVLRFDTTVSWYYLALAAFGVTTLVCSRVLRSWMGRCFAAIRLNDELGSAIGINVFRYKLAAFVVASTIAAFTGSLYGYYLGFIEPGFLSVEQSLAIIAAVLLGGRRAVAAPLVGALVLTALPHLIHLGAEVRAMTYGALLILTILLMPQGIYGALSGLASRRHAA